MKSALHFGAVLAAVLLLTPPAGAEVRLPHVISGNMVLQRDMPVPIWGWADPGEKVTVRIAGSAESATADAQGRWSVRLPAMKAGGPETMEIAGKNTLKLENILIGEVWVCSGQSNMDTGINSVLNAEKEVASANDPQIRLMYVPYRTSVTPRDDVDANWKVCSPENLRTGGSWSSGVAGRRARRLRRAGARDGADARLSRVAGPLCLQLPGGDHSLCRHRHLERPGLLPGPGRVEGPRLRGAPVLV